MSVAAWAFENRQQKMFRPNVRIVLLAVARAQWPHDLIKSLCFNACLSKDRFRAAFQVLQGRRSLGTPVYLLSVVQVRSGSGSDRIHSECRRRGRKVLTRSLQPPHVRRPNRRRIWSRRMIDECSRFASSAAILKTPNVRAVNGYIGDTQHPAAERRKLIARGASPWKTNHEKRSPGWAKLNTLETQCAPDAGQSHKYFS